MPSLKDLAKECGVSVATVSKALNDQPDIAPATRERIRAAARRMGYLPNAAARALKTNRTYNLGVLFVDEKQSGLTHEYFSAVLDSFKVEAEKRGYDITFINHNISGKSMSYLEHCHYRGVDGVVIACVNFYDPQVVELVNGDVPVVTIDHVFNNRMAILSAGMGLRTPAHRLHPRRKDRRYREPLGRLLSSLRGAGAEGAGGVRPLRCVPRCGSLRRGDPGAAGTAAAAHLHHLPG